MAESRGKEKVLIEMGDTKEQECGFIDIDKGHLKCMEKFFPMQMIVGKLLKVPYIQANLFYHVKRVMDNVYKATEIYQQYQEQLAQTVGQPINRRVYCKIYLDEKVTDVHEMLRSELELWNNASNGKIALRSKYITIECDPEIPIKKNGSLPVEEEPSSFAIRVLTVWDGCDANHCRFRWFTGHRYPSAEARKKALIDAKGKCPIDFSAIVTPMKKAFPKADKEAKLVPHCDHCNKDNTDATLCGGCKLVYYCSKECQIADWKYHKPACMVMKKHGIKIEDGKTHLFHKGPYRNFEVPSMISQRCQLIINNISKNLWYQTQDLLGACDIYKPDLFKLFGGKDPYEIDQIDKLTVDKIHVSLLSRAAKCNGNAELTSLAQAMKIVITHKPK